MTALLTERSPVHLRETTEALVIEIAAPALVDLSHMSARQVSGGIEVRLPFAARHHRTSYFNPEATGV